MLKVYNFNSRNQLITKNSILSNLDKKVIWRYKLLQLCTFYNTYNNILLAVINFYPSVVNIAFTVTPMSAPGSAALLTLFRLSGTHRCYPTWGSVFILVIRRGVCANAVVYFKAISPMTHSYRFLVSLHIHDTTYSFWISPCPLCSLLWISGLLHSTEIDSMSIFLVSSSVFYVC